MAKRAAWDIRHQEDSYLAFLTEEDKEVFAQDDEEDEYDEEDEEDEGWV